MIKRKLPQTPKPEGDIIPADADSNPYAGTSRRQIGKPCRYCTTKPTAPLNYPYCSEACADQGRATTYRELPPFHGIPSHCTATTLRRQEFGNAPSWLN